MPRTVPKGKEVDLRVELLRSSYVLGERVKGTVLIQSNHGPVDINSASLIWSSHQTLKEGEYTQRQTLTTVTQPIAKMEDKKAFEGDFVFDIDFEVPHNWPPTVPIEVTGIVGINTGLRVRVELSDPSGEIVQNHSILILQKREDEGGILQSVKFHGGPLPCLPCFCGDGLFRAHIELRHRMLTAGDTLQVTLVLDSVESRWSLPNVSILLRRTTSIHPLRTATDLIVIEEETAELASSRETPARTQTTVTLSITIPENDFCPSVDCNALKISTCLVVLFHCSLGRIVETEIPLTLLHPEAVLN